MSSGNKRSFGSLIILLLLFAFIAGISWMFFSKDKTGQLKQDLAGQVSSALGHNDNGASDSHAGHGHDTHEASSKMIGVKGEIHTLNPPKIYGHRAVGNPDAPVKIQEFFSLSCNLSLIHI